VEDLLPGADQLLCRHQAFRNGHFPKGASAKRAPDRRPPDRTTHHCATHNGAANHGPANHATSSRSPHRATDDDPTSAADIPPRPSDGTALSSRDAGDDTTSCSCGHFYLLTQARLRVVEMTRTCS